MPQIKLCILTSLIQISFFMTDRQENEFGRMQRAENERQKREKLERERRREERRFEEVRRQAEESDDIRYFQSEYKKTGNDTKYFFTFKLHSCKSHQIFKFLFFYFFKRLCLY